MNADKPLVWLRGEVKTPPFSRAARIETGVLLRRLQKGESIGMPHSRPMPDVGKRCHELRIRDAGKQWRLIYRVDTDAIVIAEIFAKTTRATPKSVIQKCKRRLSQYDSDSNADGEDEDESD
jgi:phage-related protein